VGDTYLGLPIAEYEAIQARLKGRKGYTVDSLGRAWGSMPDMTGVYLVNGQAFFPEAPGPRPQSGLWTAPEVPKPAGEVVQIKRRVKPALRRVKLPATKPINKHKTG
jgi:hypothetical protein